MSVLQPDVSPGEWNFRKLRRGTLQRDLRSPEFFSMKKGRRFAPPHQDPVKQIDIICSEGEMRLRGGGLGLEAVLHDCMGTRPGDFVFDPFMGGGTTLLEAMVAGRRVAGSDISELAVFITQVKTTLVADEVAQELRSWAEGLLSALNIRRFPVRHPERTFSD